MSTRASQLSVVTTQYGDRPIIDLPVLGMEKHIQSSFTPEVRYRKHRKERAEHRNFQTYRHLNPGAMIHNQQPQSTSLSKSNLLQTTYLPAYMSNHQGNILVPQTVYQQPVTHSTFPTEPLRNIRHSGLPIETHHYYGSNGETLLGHPTEIHHYYGPNGEQLSGPPKALNKENIYPTDFILKGTLEYGRLVSINIERGSLSFRDIPAFLLTHLRETFRSVSQTKISIIAENGAYNIYS